MKYSYSGFRLIKGRTAKGKTSKLLSFGVVLLDCFIHRDQTSV